MNHENVCLACGTGIRAIKNRRKNGGMGFDWPSRKYHVKCWKAIGNRTDATDYSKLVLCEQKTICDKCGDHFEPIPMRLRKQYGKRYVVSGQKLCIICFNIMNTQLTKWSETYKSFTKNEENYNNLVKYLMS